MIRIFIVLNPVHPQILAILILTLYLRVLCASVRDKILTRRHEGYKESVAL